MNSIRNYRYSIVLSTPIGEKKGIMTFDTFHDKIDGSLFIMRNENYFCGIIKSDGKCNISGSIKTLAGNVNYHAEGYIDEYTVTLVLNTGKRKFIISGELLQKEEL
ncbi:MAG: hypothetical protein ACI4J2_06905 [Ruminococcus sp.]